VVNVLIFIEMLIFSTSVLDICGSLRPLFSCIGVFDTRKNGQPPKSQLVKKVNSLKTPTIAFWLFKLRLTFWLVDF